ncbi:hypothetical protein COW36_16910 [bacterium (Candidatus Blackallbacteria) CG17_big_fil_post_rev_8_21_14_2_50_48_46]|uniref:SCP domain-containing protein n=1 Tax=bacterium (Candidatus Blackallbacteria) CG17_big_fil_post_rev_8_21_14_2_50_48_46 TaxID=2014261 RepID=A0A2M7G297_9BACT|nr:MAG: hypothetical protein COW64_09220 [bacterium (Candidatus Blackallbacteria) CG18_big_fil_WC_8_21_14_2_50_49_26]PIW15484.1 MAG: hypothetical protein COW36_16910 [bacterium (Candidatus Blackallbacteria) CG17_big_fil_post_rev_8_21_14_2_50_48_46]PIW48616.1 MAG: hypothetical protein COW20_08935 [bacterium (Candidatus Blackallbacteria) CG13_big_fil_rev_8_21_14_2_50_49_14]
MRSVFVISLFFFMALTSPVLAQNRVLMAEYQLLNMVNQYRQRMKLSPVKLDRLASEVARQHSDEMAAKDFFDLRSPNRGSLEHQLAYQRVTGRQVNALIVLDYSLTEVFSQLQKNTQLLEKTATHAGVGVHLRDPEHPEKGIWFTLIYLQHFAQFEPIPRQQNPGNLLRIKGRVFEPYFRPRMPVTLPNGQVKTFPNLLRSNQSFIFEIPMNQGKGKYTLELLVDDPIEGPRVGSILPVYVGKTYPLAEPSPSPLKEQFATTLEAARKLVFLINQERLKHNLPELKENDLLDYVSWKHSEDMAKNRFFAHLNPKGEDPNERFHRAGGTGQVGENIAFDLSVEGAHHRLMNSPGHRANILDSRFTHLGVGVYYNGTYYFITQLFQRKAPLVDAQTSSEKILKWMNQQRMSKRLSPFIEDATLHEAALQHSYAMAMEDQLKYQVGGQNFNQRLSQLRYGEEVQAILVLADSLDDALEKLSKYKLQIVKRKVNVAGIGIYQAKSSDYGENSLWITIGLSSRN